MQSGHTTFISFLIDLFRKKKLLSVARVEDHDDLTPIFNRQSDMLKMTYGDYFLAELIEAQDDHMHCLVAEVSDVANLVLPRHAGKMSGFLRQQNNTIYAYKSIKQSMLSPFKFILRRRIFKTFLLRCYVALLRHDIVVAFMAQIFDVKANENAHYKRNELEFMFLW